MAEYPNIQASEATIQVLNHFCVLHFTHFCTPVAQCVFSCVCECVPYSGGYIHIVSKSRRFNLFFALNMEKKSMHFMPLCVMQHLKKMSFIDVLIFLEHCYYIMFRSNNNNNHKVKVATTTYYTFVKLSQGRSSSSSCCIVIVTLTTVTVTLWSYFLCAGNIATLHFSSVFNLSIQRCLYFGCLQLSSFFHYSTLRMSHLIPYKLETVAFTYIFSLVLFFLPESSKLILCYSCFHCCSMWSHVKSVWMCYPRKYVRLNVSLARTRGWCPNGGNGVKWLSPCVCVL